MRTEAHVDAIEAMRSRRSNRSEAASEPIPEDSLALILECGTVAPSSKNAKPWNFHVTGDPTTLDAIAAAMIESDTGEPFVPLDPLTGRKHSAWPSSVVESAATLRAADVGVFVENLGVFSRSRRTIAQVPRDLQEDALLGFSLELLGIGGSIQNMWIAATALGVGASFMGDVVIAEAVVQRHLGFGGDLVGALALRVDRQT